MHPCLSIPEIQHAICAEMYDSPDYQHRGTLLSLALVCKDLLQPALACLWTDMSDILPIIHLFPDGLSQLKDKGWYREETGILDHESSCAISGCEHSGSRPHYHYDYYDKTQQIPTYQLTRPIQPSDWDRPDIYSPFVKHLTLGMSKRPCDQYLRSRHPPAPCQRCVQSRYSAASASPLPPIRHCSYRRCQSCGYVPHTSHTSRTKPQNVRLLCRRLRWQLL